MCSNSELVVDSIARGYKINGYHFEIDKKDNFVAFPLETISDTFVTVRHLNFSVVDFPSAFPLFEHALGEIKPSSKRYVPRFSMKRSACTGRGKIQCALRRLGHANGVCEGKAGASKQHHECAFETDL